MDNPFNSLKQEGKRLRKKNQEEARQKQQELEKRRQEEKLISQQKKEVAWEHHKVVGPVIEQLQQAIYPDSILGLNLDYWYERSRVILLYESDDQKYENFYRLERPVESDTVWDWSPSWRIGTWNVYGFDKNLREFSAYVIVYLEFDDDNKPIRYRCLLEEEAEDIEAGLSQEDLIAGLKQLHLPNIASIINDDEDD